MTPPRAPRRFGLIGAGRIGGAVIDAWRGGALPGWTLAGVLTRGTGATTDAPPVVRVAHLDALLAAGCELIVEAAGPAAFAAHAAGVLEACDLWAVSPAPLADPSLAAAIDAAARRGGHRLRILSGAIAGLDGVAMMAVDDDAQLQLSIDLPPGHPAGEGRPPGVLFAGTVREAARRFPDAVNVAVAAALAGPGLDRSRIEVVKPDPPARHRLALRATGRFGTVEAAVSPRLAPGVHPVAASIVAALRDRRP